jgi:threonine/homoserine/homoserine lactone efflux protein
MGQGISEVLVPGIGVAISTVPIIAVILMLFSQRARSNGPAFLIGWMLALTFVFGVVYVLADQGNAATSSTASDTISWGQIVFGVLLLLVAARTWRNRPEPGAEAEMPKWMAGVDSLTPGKAFGLGLLLDGLNPKNLLLTIGAASGLAQLGLSGSDVVVSLIVFVILGSISIAVPVIYYMAGGDAAESSLDSMKQWLTIHSSAVMTVVLLIVGVDLIAKGIPPLTS